MGPVLVTLISSVFFEATTAELFMLPFFVFFCAGMGAPLTSS
ncbi:hypothetical protein ATPR_3259 [Acetobacter tropicalis NBRC 101654]|uniref:Uncharacterized protein n=1 Tax=Acetobacter tropicalis NBRC 101654 TaxID=749388 RepID=F7VIR0_9PROT|nr:hypothetical protein ATPR_3259 [Acetobacter tropicalis NBRC 101654]